ncbi:MAG: hypothetical protein KGI84_05720, partial [Elusimicrobia bacterium]|nr:hypothetical protein [Elusimicrobiota bacterium]
MTLAPEAAPPIGMVFPEPDHISLKHRLHRFRRMTLHKILTAAKSGAISHAPAERETLTRIREALLNNPQHLDSCLKSSGVTPIIWCFSARDSWTGQGQPTPHPMTNILSRLAEEIADPHEPPWIIAPGLRLTTDDTNPLCMEEAHPEKSGNKPDWGGRKINEWLESLRTAFSLINRIWPELNEEFSLLIDRIIPVGYDPSRHLSASYREAIGTIYLTLHPDPLVMATALIHEFQHNKINLISYFDPLLHNAHSPLYHSPVRPDPRPLWGILLAVHAFVPVERFYRRISESRDSILSRNDFQALIEETRQK